LGYILGAALTTPAVSRHFHEPGLEQERRLQRHGTVLRVLLPWSPCSITTFGVKEVPNPDLVPAKMPPLSQLKFIFKNRPFVQYMIMSTIISISFTLLTSLLPYYLTYQLKMTPEIPFVMFVMLATIGIFLLPWRFVSKKLSKGPSYALGLAIASAAILVTFFLPTGPTPIIYGVAFVAGLGSLLSTSSLEHDPRCDRGRPKSNRRTP
jgi:Na+/melibiose symporter-like transporter